MGNLIPAVLNIVSNIKLKNLKKKTPKNAGIFQKVAIATGIAAGAEHATGTAGLNETLLIVVEILSLVSAIIAQFQASKEEKKKD